MRAQGKICILDIDIQGVQNIKKSSLDCRYIFIAPPSIEALEQRLRGRATETEDKVKVRLDNAIAEITYGNKAGNFDCVIVNNVLEIALQDAMNQMRLWFPDVRGI